MGDSYAEWRRTDPRGQAPQRESGLFHVWPLDFFQISNPLW